MSRSIGDVIAHTVGVSATPEIKQFKIDGKEWVLIVASDGLWEFLSNEEVRDIVQDMYEQD